MPAMLGRGRDRGKRVSLSLDFGGALSDRFLLNCRVTREEWRRAREDKSRKMIHKEIKKKSFIVASLSET